MSKNKGGGSVKPKGGADKGNPLFSPPSGYVVAGKGKKK